MKGTFTVIFYGGGHLNDLETSAILDVGGDQYTFEPYAPNFNYKVMKGLPAKKALEESINFVSNHPDFMRFELSKILNKAGITVGYEIRPLYHPITFGSADVINIYYRIGPQGKMSPTPVTLEPVVMVTIRSKSTW